MFVIGLYWVAGLVNFEAGGLVAERKPQRQRIQLLLTLLLCVVALLATPYGSRVATMPFELAANEPLSVANVQEWQALSLSTPLGRYFAIVVIGLFLAQITLQLTYKLEDMAMLLFAVYAMCAHVRFAMIFVIFLTPILAGILARWVPFYDPGKDRYLLRDSLLSFASTDCYFNPLLPVLQVSRAPGHNPRPGLGRHDAYRPTDDLGALGLLWVASGRA